MLILIWCQTPVFPLRSPFNHGEDLYLQCDFSDDAIYSNDPACNLSILADPSEDLYILPDAWWDVGLFFSNLLVEMF